MTVTAVGAVFFPLDRQLHLQEKHWSEGTRKLMVWLSGIVDYRKAEEIVARVGQIHVSDNTVWQRLQEWGERFESMAETERIRANVLPGRWGAPCREREERGGMGVAIDGTMIHLRGAGWKELKVASVFDIEVRPTVDRETGEREEFAHAVHNSYVAHLGGPELLGQKAWAEAARRGWEQAVDTEVIGDAAPWIWNVAGDHFYDSQPVVDWYHATEHLTTAAHLLKGEGTVAAIRWYNAQETALFEGHAARIAATLRAEADRASPVADALQREANYLLKNQRRMNYQEMREEGWAMGSGMVESAGKQFKARFTGPGMHWTREGAERLIPVRAAIMSGRFDELWHKAYNSPPN